MSEQKLHIPFEITTEDLAALVNGETLVKEDWKITTVDLKVDFNGKEFSDIEEQTRTSFIPVLKLK